MGKGKEREEERMEGKERVRKRIKKDWIKGLKKKKD